MNETTPLVLVLGATGRTGSRAVSGLTARGLQVRTAARSGADVRFDWNDVGTHAPALAGVDRLYLVSPLLRTDYAADVSAFLDKAQAAGVRHVTYLSAYGIEAAPADVAPRAVELDLMGRDDLGWSILRPAWFMQNFSDLFLKPVDGAIIAPTGDGTEAFVDAEDIAAVAVETLADPRAHNGGEYAITGPEALTVADVAAIIGDAAGQDVKHVDLDREAWVAGAVANGVPAAYGEVLRELTETIATGRGARPNDVVEKVTGRPPRSFKEFAARTASVWKENNR
ncbi:NmrA family NAD(P)-binding protein [Amycolatopsis sp. NPDC098790]|uniref:NmrA family NAD(P)-binding protein n=1 Tax=Amycolatopsis sp. NPDC098790 TaxID=3363939 RepID=UPI0037F59D2A